MYFVQDAHSFWNWVYFVLLIVVCPMICIAVKKKIHSTCYHMILLSLVTWYSIPLFIPRSDLSSWSTCAWSSSPLSSLRRNVEKRPRWKRKEPDSSHHPHCPVLQIQRRQTATGRLYGENSAFVMHNSTYAFSAVTFSESMQPNINQSVVLNDETKYPRINWFIDKETRLKPTPIPSVWSTTCWGRPSAAVAAPTKRCAPDVWQRRRRCCWRSRERGSSRTTTSWRTCQRTAWSTRLTVRTVENNAYRRCMSTQ